VVALHIFMTPRADRLSLDDEVRAKTLRRTREIFPGREEGGSRDRRIASLRPARAMPTGQLSPFLLQNVRWRRDSFEPLPWPGW